jgi:phage FluMu protein Com
MEYQKYLSCKKCNSLIRFSHWSAAKERLFKELKCPHCSALKSLKILKKREYYKLKHETYISLVVKRDGNEVIISRGLK